jgi:hypothetical protein
MFYPTFLSFIGITLTLTSLVANAALVRVTSFGYNPSGALMYINVPSRLATNPAVLLAVSIIAS